MPLRKATETWRSAAAIENQPWKGYPSCPAHPLVHSRAQAAAAVCWGLRAAPSYISPSGTMVRRAESSAGPGCACAQKPIHVWLQRGIMQQEISLGCAPQDWAHPVVLHTTPSSHTIRGWRSLCALVLAFLDGLLPTSPECNHSFNRGGIKLLSCSPAEAPLHHCLPAA